KKEVEKRKIWQRILLITHESPSWLLFASAIGSNADQAKIIRGSDSDFIKNAEVRELSFIPLPHNHDYELDFHRPFIDEVKIVCDCLPRRSVAEAGGGEMRRIEDVFDVWFESGSMPYSEPSFPADFIAEGLDQTRGWFYSLLVLGVGLFEKSPYKNVIVNGLILAEDGQKMSKRLNNYPDLNLTINKYGADAIRFYLLSSPAVRAEDFSFSERGLGEVMRRVIMRLKNVLAFYQLYDTKEEFNFDLKAKPVLLDTWLTSRLNELNMALASALDNYELDQVSKPIDQFVDDLSTWFLRRSRERFKSDNIMERATVVRATRHILITLAKLIAPIMPFTAEEIFQALRTSSDAESVHLTAWPEVGRVDNNLLTQMSEVRKIVSLGLEARAKAGVKVRQPLQILKINSQGQSLKPAKDCPCELLDLIKDEVNVKEIIFVEKLEKEVELDLKITPELKLEGEARDLMRAL
ncbi:MAG: class I tRNA ligase family protein, partial [Patescibacteria group bacterium]